MDRYRVKKVVRHQKSGSMRNSVVMSKDEAWNHLLELVKDDMSEGYEFTEITNGYETDRRSHPYIKYEVVNCDADRIIPQPTVEFVSLFDFMEGRQ